MSTRLSFSTIVVKLVISAIAIFLIQQVSHEVGHAIMCLVLGGRIVYFFVGLSYGHVICNIANIPIFITIQRLFGGIFAAIVLFVILEKAETYWWELRTVNLAFIFVNITLAFLEGFFFSFYELNRNTLSYLFLPFFFLSVYLIVFRNLERFKASI